jgi:hypothetical protein
MTKATLYHHGLVKWEPPAIFKSSCDIDVRYVGMTTFLHIHIYRWGERVFLKGQSHEIFDFWFFPRIHPIY